MRDIEAVARAEATRQYWANPGCASSLPGYVGPFTVGAEWAVAHMIAPHTPWGEDEFDRWLDQVLAEARREGQAEAWDECATESGYRGWMHDYAVTEMQERNPYWNGADQ